MTRKKTRRLRPRIKRREASTRTLNNPMTAKLVQVGATHGVQQWCNTPQLKFLNTQAQN